MPEKLTAQDQANIERVLAHVAHLIVDPREQRLFIDWMAFIVQKRKRVNWAILLQGVEGDGKTFFFELLSAVLGGANVLTVPASLLGDRFNTWAEGYQVVFVEEVYLRGKHYSGEALNAIKPNITNQKINIHAKGIDTYQVLNKSSYFLTTNHRDALPLDNNDRRYFVLSSRFQTKEVLQAFVERNPTYYPNLYATLDSPGALRHLLLNWKISPDFDAKGRAPDSAAKDYMVEMNKPEGLEELEEAMAESDRPDMCDGLLNVTDLGDIMLGMESIVPPTRTLAKILTYKGLTKLGAVRIDKRYVKFWSNKPERYMTDGKFDPEKVRQVLFPERYL